MLKNLKRLREELCITQKQLADGIGVSQQSVNKYENHKVEPDIATLVRMAQYFDTSVDYLIGNCDVRRKIEVTREYELNQDEIDMIEKFRKLSGKQKHCINVVIDTFLE